MRDFKKNAEVVNKSSETAKETHICPICGKTFKGFGNNPQPLLALEHRCCDDCNNNYVIPVRIYGVSALPSDVAKRLLDFRFKNNI